MNRYLFVSFWALFVSLAVSLSGCDRGVTPGYPHERIRMRLKNQPIVVEVACDRKSRRLGLMYRKELPENDGMLFLFRRKEKLSFWMKNTFVPLSIAYLDDDGRILQIEAMEPLDKTSVWAKQPTRYALEMNQGWFAKNNVAVGDRIDDFEAAIARFRVQ